MWYCGYKILENNEIFRDEDKEAYPDRDPDVPVAPFEEVIKQLNETDAAETHLIFTLTWYGTRNVLDHWTVHAKNKVWNFMKNLKNIAINIIIQKMKRKMGRKAMLGYGL